MAEPTPAERLAQLRQRWERDPKSRLFLQLAEEYRRAGRLSEAVRILESGLAHHPTYVAAQVVMGRCLLETGDVPRAVTVLERAVKFDPTQLVANRLLVEAYLGVDNVAKARERLDIYRVLNDRDVEVEALEARIGALGGVARPIVTRGRVERDDRSGERRLYTPAPAPAAAPAPPRVHEPAPAPEPVTTAFGKVFAAVATSASAPAKHRGRAETPFGQFHRPSDRNRIVAAIAAGGVFPVAPRRIPPPAKPAAIVAPPAPAPRALDVAPPIELPRVELPEPPPVLLAAAPPPAPEIWSPEPFELGIDSMPVEESGAVVEPAPASPADESWFELEGSLPEPLPATEPVPAPAPPAAPASSGSGSATLGSLYLAQGHLEDAEESFEAVLRTRPDDSDARRGLDEVRRRKSEAAAAFFDEMPAATPDSSSVVGGLTARKIDLLRQFMSRMRRGGSAHVS